MPETNDLDKRHLDDQLAAFTDALFASSDAPVTHGLSDDPELRELQQIAIALHETISSVEPDAETANRIREHLVAQWYEHGMNAKPEPQKVNLVSAQRRKFSLPVRSRTHRRLVWGFAVAMVAVLLAVVLTRPDGGVGLTATAMGDAGMIVGAILAFVLIVFAVLAWFLRPKR